MEVAQAGLKPPGKMGEANNLNCVLATWPGWRKRVKMWRGPLDCSILMHFGDFMYFNVEWKDVQHSKILESQTQTHQLPICLPTWCKKNCVCRVAERCHGFNLVGDLSVDTA